LLTIETR